MNTNLIPHHQVPFKGFHGWPREDVRRHVERCCRVTPPVAAVIASLAFNEVR